MLQRENRIIGIEVKKGEHVRSRSLRVFVDAKSSKHISLDLYISKGLIDETYLAEVTKGGIGRDIRSIPIYTAGCRFPYDE